MRLTLVQGPQIPLVSVDECKMQLHVDTSASDTQIESLIEAATAYLDGFGGILGRALRPQTWRLDLPAFPAVACGIELPLPPTIAVSSVSYLDGTTGLEVVLDPTQYRVISGGSRGALIRPAIGITTWPTPYAGEPDSVRVVFDAGYQSISSPENDAVPQSIREAAIMLVASWYDRPALEDIPEAVYTLIAPYRLAMLT